MGGTEVGCGEEQDAGAPMIPAGHGEKSFSADSCVNEIRHIPKRRPKDAF